jgi:DNA-binding NtrC family response regulator
MGRTFDWLKRITSSDSRRSARTSGSGSVTVLAVSVPDTEYFRVEQVASSAGWESKFARTCEEAERLLEHRQFSVILLDRDLADIDWRTAIERLKKSAPTSCILLISGINDEYLWREVIQRGGFDIISKPLSQDQLQAQIDHAWFFWKSDLSRQAAN